MGSVGSGDRERGKWWASLWDFRNGGKVLGTREVGGENQEWRAMGRWLAMRARSGKIVEVVRGRICGGVVVAVLGNGGGGCSMAAAVALGRRWRLQHSGGNEGIT